MKRFCIVALALLLAMTLFGCREEQTLYNISWHKPSYQGDCQIDTEKKTISDGRHIYRYTYEGDTESYQVTITYPNGATYYYSKSDGSGSGGWSDDYDEKTYAPGDVLVDMLVSVRKQMPQKGVDPGKILAALVLIGGGIFCIACPETVWYWGAGWRFRDVEPSDMALTVARLNGVAAVIIGIIVMLC